MMKNCRRAVLLLLSSLCLAVLATTSAFAQADERAAIEWIRHNAIPIQTVEAGHGFADLQPLDKVIGNARVVELGEATHGTREFFQLKHRLIEYLATQKGFTIFSIEANMPEAYRLNDYVLHGNGDPKQLLKGMYFWTWDTQEVLDMILWMREFNASGKGRIEFTGFDMQTPTLPLETVRKFLSHQDPAYFSATLDPLYSEVQRSESTQTGFAVASASIPANAAYGKRVTLSGNFRSENITHGWAGLWLRADGVNNVVVAFKNMQDQGVTGTTPWTRHEISIDVPVNAQRIVFGALHNGTGTAWVDNLSIAINGVPYTADSGFDLDFESPTPRGFYTGGAGYEVAIDPGVAYTGKQSLRMARLNSASAPMSREALEGNAKKCAAVVDYLSRNRNEYLKSGLPAHEVDWVIQNARLVEQYAAMQAGLRGRDESMAENIKWIADQNPGAKIVVWAHNAHVAYGAWANNAAMGSYLRKDFGPQLINFGFAFNEGSFQAVEKGKGLHSFTVAPASPADGTLDLALAKTGIPIFAVDLRRVPTTGPVAEWFSMPHPSRSIGSMYSEENARFFWGSSHAPQDYDVLLFVEKTSAARPN
jgi:erythromycin esterase-like protein